MQQKLGEETSKSEGGILERRQSERDYPNSMDEIHPSLWLISEACVHALDSKLLAAKAKK